MSSPQISERRLAANRANALKSTGPRTPAGKQRVSQNACTIASTPKSTPLPPNSRPGPSLTRGTNLLPIP